MGFQSVLAIYLMIIARVGAFLLKFEARPGLHFACIPSPVCLGLLGDLVFGVVFVFQLFFGGFLGLCWYWLATV